MVKNNKIGFIGLGIMGLPMAKNILSKGYDITVYNRSAEKAKELESLGAKISLSPKELAKECDIIIMMLSDEQAIHSIVWENDLYKELNQDKVLINMSTVSPKFAKKLAENLEDTKMNYIDAPVSGSKKPAEDGELVILAGGDKEKITELDELFLCMGKKVVYCGEVGKGSMMKMAINLMLGICMESMAEMLNYGEMGGLEKDAMLDVILSGALANPLFNIKAQLYKNEDYSAQFPFKHMHKDLKFIKQTADEYNINIPVGEKVLELFEKGMNDGYGDEDIASVKKTLSN